MELTDILYHLGEDQPYQGTAGSPPIHQTSNFVFQSTEEMRHALKHENEVPFYTRGTNPTVQLLQKKMAALEGTEDALMTSSGSAAVATAVLANVQSGDHVLCITKPYSWTFKLMDQMLPKYGVQVTIADGKDKDAFLSHVRAETQIIFVESPNSWTFEMQDIEAIASFAKERGILTIIDNSYATPLLQQPAHYGIDLIIHSATKYLNGHSDVVAGAICGSKSLIKKLFQTTYMTLGASMSPFDAWLMLRSLRTLPVRLEQIGKTAQKVAEYLETHPKVKNFFYPFSSSYDQEELAKKYLGGPGGLMTIDLNTDDTKKIVGFCDALKKFKLGCSWGSYESLAFPAITSADSLNYDNPNIVKERVRLSIGLDSADILIADLQNAFDKV